MGHPARRLFKTTERHEGREAAERGADEDRRGPPGVQQPTTKAADDNGAVGGDTHTRERCTVAVWRPGALEMAMQQGRVCAGPKRSANTDHKLAYKQGGQRA